jgi:hypothetical protein
MRAVTEEPWVFIARAPQDGRPPRIIDGPFPGAEAARRRKRDFERATGATYALCPVHPTEPTEDMSP